MLPNHSLKKSELHWGNETKVIEVFNPSIKHHTCNSHVGTANKHIHKTLIVWYAPYQGLVMTGPVVWTILKYE